MKKIFLIILLPFLANAQYYSATSNLFSTNNEANNLDLGINYEFKNTQLQALYNITEKYSVFATYNFNKTTTEYTTFLWGSKKAIDVDNSGYTVGLLYHIKGRLGRFKNLEVLVGVENQTVFTADYFINYRPESKEYLTEQYYKIFTQFNMTKIRKNVDIGYSFKLSYLKFIAYNYYFGSKGNLDGKETFFIDPTYNLNFKPDGNNNFKLTAQIGFSAALNTLKDEQITSSANGIIYSTYTEEVYLLSPILKFGLQYQFNLKKQKL